MKKQGLLLFILVVALIFSGCSRNSMSYAAKEPKLSADIATTAGNSSSTTAIPLIEESAIASTDGITVEIVGIHKTKDSNGDAIIAVEFKFQNDNTEPANFSGFVVIEAYQGGIQLSPDDNIYLEEDYDWDSQNTLIKDGASITVYVPLPLNNETTDVEINVKLWDEAMSKLVAAKKTFKMPA